MPAAVCDSEAYVAFNLKHSISFATYLAANFGWDWFRVMLEIVSKVLRAAIWSGCSIRLESVQMPFSWTRHDQFRHLNMLLCTWFNLEHVDLECRVAALDLAMKGSWYLTNWLLQMHDLFLCLLFIQRPMTDVKIEQSNISAALVVNKFPQTLKKISFYVRKSWSVVTAHIYKVF